MFRKNARKRFMINKTLFFRFFSSKYGIHKFKTCLAIIFVFIIVLFCLSRQFRLLSVKLINIENHFFTRRQKAHFVGSIFRLANLFYPHCAWTVPCPCAGLICQAVFDLETNQIVWKKTLNNNRNYN